MIEREQGFIHPPDSENERIANELQSTEHEIVQHRQRKAEADMKITQIMRLRETEPGGMQSRLVEEQTKAGDISARIVLLEEKAGKLRQKLF